MLEARQITIKYDSCEVLQDVSLAVETGSIVAVLGENGAGKTTLLKALNGTLPLAAGEIRLDGRDLKNYSRREISQRISVVAQENETKFPITVLEFVLSGRFAHGGIFGWESVKDLSHAEEALAACDLKGYEQRLMHKLSGGERQRVVFARALATAAPILLLDEPTANLDLAHQALLFRLVREYCQARRMAAVINTHDLNLAAEFADQVLLLQRGRIVAQGTASEVLSAKNLKTVFRVDVIVDRHPQSGRARVTPSF